jgi:dTDP-4-amino-4,6-dideoxygalactose transaminase
MGSDSIPFHRPRASGRELDYTAQVTGSFHLSGHGESTRRLQRDLTFSVWVPKVSTDNIVHGRLGMVRAFAKGLVQAMKLSFPASRSYRPHMLLCRVGARPVFVNIDSVTVDVTPGQVEAAISPKARAMVVVHYAAVGCDIQSIMELANKHRIPVVEDSTHGPGGSYRGQPLVRLERYCR